MSNTNPTDRRDLHFATLDDLRADLDMLEMADRAGELTTVGNWTPGQVLGHVAAWIHYGWDGYPIKAPPFFIRWYLRWQLPKMLKGKMPTGVRIPGVEGGTTGIEPVEFADALARMRQGIDRLESDDPAPYHSPAFGEMSMADRIDLNLRHAELHFSFLRYPGDS